MSNVVQLPYQKPAETIDHFRFRRALWRAVKGWMIPDHILPLPTAEQREEIGGWQERYLPLDLPLFQKPLDTIDLHRDSKEAS